MSIMENRIYFTYMVLGSLYLISKLIYYVFGWVCLPGLMLGLVASVLTILIGIASFKEYKKSGQTHSSLVGCHRTIDYYALLSTSYDYEAGNSCIPIFC